MRSQLANHFRSVREEQGLGFVELARIVGYKNVTKGCNRIQQFEQRDEVHADLLRKLADALGVDNETVDRLIDEDHREHVRKWNKWADQPIRPYLVTRLIPAVYSSKKLPEDC